LFTKFSSDYSVLFDKWLEMSQTEVEFSVPFPSPREAEIVFNVLRVDKEPQRNAIQKKLFLDDNILKVKISGEQTKNVRVVVNAIFDAILLSTETIHEFGPASQEYDHY